MKLINIITHPILIATAFSLIVISGEKFSWFYIIIIMVGVTQFSLHSIVGIIGILLILFTPSGKISKRSAYSLSLLCVICLFLSLFVFFESDTNKYNWNTFSDFTSRYTFILFGMLSTGFLIKQLTGIAKFLIKGKNKLFIEK